MTRRMFVLAAMAGLLASFAVAGTSIRRGTGPRPERAGLRPQHVDERDPGGGRLGGEPAGLQPVRDAALRPAVQARHLWIQHRPAQLPGRLLHRVAGLGQSPNDVVINGSVYVRNQCNGGSCIALNNFWRSLSNLTINVTTPDFGCYSGEFWAVSQAAPMRRVHVNGLTTLMDYCTGPSFASGGFIADSAFDGSTVINGSQQQWLVRNSSLDGWTNGVWNQVFSGVVGAPAQCFPARRMRRPVHDAARRARSRARRPTCTWTPPGATRSSSRRRSATPWARRGAAGRRPARRSPSTTSSSPGPRTTRQAINKALAKGRNVIFTPGVYQLDQTIKVKRAGTVVLGLGFPTLVPTGGDATMTVADVAGVKLAGLMFDAGPGTRRSCSRWARRTRTRATPTTRRRSATCSSASAGRPRARPPRASS